MSATSTPPRTPRVPRQPQERVIPQPIGKGGGKAAAAAPAADDEKTGKLAKLGKKKLIIIAAVVALVIGGAAYYFLVMSKAPKEKPAPKPGAVVALESTSINLADGHYLRIGVALQLTEEASGGGEGSSGPDGSKAKDLVIATFSGQKMEAVQKPAEREKLKGELKEKIAEAYEHEVMDIYFTEFVTQ